MNENAELQLEHFNKRINHARRFRWQAEDPFVCEREHATIRPLFEALKAERERAGRTLRVLESGCGEGVNAIHLGQMGLTCDDAVIDGIDVSAEAVAEAQRHGIAASVGDGLALPFPDGSFDVVYTRDVFHHLADDGERRQFFDEMRRVAGPNGMVIVVEPNPRNPMIFAFGLLVRAERGILTGKEVYLSGIFRGACVSRTCPSAAWRGWYHYRSPLRDWALTSLIVKTGLRVWEALCRHLPTSLWAWRVYTYTERSR